MALDTLCAFISLSSTRIRDKKHPYNAASMILFMEVNGFLILINRSWLRNIILIKPSSWWCTIVYPLNVAPHHCSNVSTCFTALGLNVCEAAILHYRLIKNQHHICFFISGKPIAVFARLYFKNQIIVFVGRATSKRAIYLKCRTEKTIPQLIMGYKLY